MQAGDRGPGDPKPEVRFTDAQLIAAGVAPPFPDEEGTYEDPDVVSPGGRPPANPPRELDCPGSLVIYASEAEWVPGCPVGRDNPANQAAYANAKALAEAIKCRDGCRKAWAEIWRGWHCGPEQGRFLVIGAVEIKVACNIEE